ncbi:PREDICTED: uncharacterized protein LOC106815751 [Priapulus caudatus]|uniref:Uncharacterized protein LOC106815751 n=1 Tax=Priapulus caudatus TaxID=37621 RepID=A0ABM1EU74_PRICU|nr:PREDICTED: uncharacterized protein LOC106815751 [Priapulus caudatus]
MDCNALAEVCDSQEFSHALVTRHEWGQLAELCKILEPFAEATNLTQGDESVTVMLLDINSHLWKWEDDARFCKPLVSALHTSLERRFRGIFVNCEIDENQGSGSHQEPFAEKLYLVAAVLDPQYMLHWVDADVVVAWETDRVRKNLKHTLTGMLNQ